MVSCDVCCKHVNKIAYSRHKKGHGIGGAWRLRAQIYKKLQKPNLHKFNGMTLCSKCLKTFKKTFKPKVKVASEAPAAAVS